MQPGPLLVRLDEATSTLTVSGEVDDGSVADLRRAIAEAAAQGAAETLAVDLSEVSFLPSAAISALVGATQDAASRGRSVELVAERGTIAQRVLEVCALPHRTA